MLRVHREVALCALAVGLISSPGRVAAWEAAAAVRKAGDDERVSALDELLVALQLQATQLLGASVWPKALRPGPPSRPNGPAAGPDSKLVSSGSPQGCPGTAPHARRGA